MIRKRPISTSSTQQYQTKSNYNLSSSSTTGAPDDAMVQKRTSSSSSSLTVGGGSSREGYGHYDNDDDDDGESTGVATTTNYVPPPPSHYRSLDAFLEEAVVQSSSSSSSSQSFSILHHQHSPWRFWLIFLSLGVANSSDATEILCLSYILSNTDFNSTILMETTWRAGILASMVFLGMLLGGLWVGVAGDVQGRRPMLLFGLATNTISGILSSLSVNVWMLALLRFASGLGIGATVPPLFTLCSELAPAHDRGFWVSVAASFWMVGSIYVALVAWILLEEGLNWSWRIFALVCALPSAAGFIMVYHFVPESPRFLALQGHKRQSQEALSVAHGLARTLHYTGPEWTMEELLHQYPLSFEHHERGNHHNVDDEVSVGPITTGSASWKSRVQESAHDFTSSVKLLYTPQLRQTTWPLQMVWFSLSFGSYGLMTWINTLFVKVHLKNVYWNALLFALSNLPGNILSVTLMDRTGRSSLLIGSIMAAAMSLLAFAYVAAIDSRNDNIDKNSTSTVTLPRGWIVLAACSFQCFTIAAWNCIDVMTSELFPTKVRSTGMGICAATGRIAAMLAQFINGATVQHPTLLLCIAAVTLAVGGTTPALLPDADKTGKVMTDNVGGRQQEEESIMNTTANTHDDVMCELGQSTAGAPIRYHPYDALRNEDGNCERETSIE